MSECKVLRNKRTLLNFHDLFDTVAKIRFWKYCNDMQEWEENTFYI